MESLLLNEEQMLSLNQLISKLEEKFGKDYIYQPEHILLYMILNLYILKILI